MLPKDTPVIILCGGEGSRIADVSRDAVPKPLLRIGDKPILWHIMKIYEAHGFSNFILALGHLGWEIKDYFLNERLMDCDFRLEVDGDQQRIELLCEPARTRALDHLRRNRRGDPDRRADRPLPQICDRRPFHGHLRRRGRRHGRRGARPRSRSTRARSGP